MCRPTRKWNRGRLTRMGDTSEDYAHPQSTPRCRMIIGACGRPRRVSELPRLELTSRKLSAAYTRRSGAAEHHRRAHGSLEPEGDRAMNEMKASTDADPTALPGGALPPGSLAAGGTSTRSPRRNPCSSTPTPNAPADRRRHRISRDGQAD